MHLTRHSSLGIEATGHERRLDGHDGRGERPNGDKTEDARCDFSHTTLLTSNELELKSLYVCGCADITRRPNGHKCSSVLEKPRQPRNRLTGLVFWHMGLGRVELPTSRLSGVRSNHLSYRPALLDVSTSSRLDV